ncbi:MAG: MoxR family ATPase [Spirochaetaceae bacterium]|jgi:MoxR-like ATPase|nr:MoxR family ATPase [Spirochaetaceae bacterium]GMO20602.1 MAG: MoxR family ATPase [Termitinemataceae bacterium]
MVLEDDVINAADKLKALREEVAKEFTGQGELVETALIALLAGGHILVEGVPGLGKTLLVRAFARAIGGESARVQFTPDLMPSDITGNIMLDAAQGGFITKRGPVFTNIFIADEINRAPAKTQAALFEAMQEFQVTLDGKSYPLPRPFMTLATENPFEHEGTYPLPDAQKDRFLLKIIVNYPSFEEETAMVKRVTASDSGGAELSVAAVKAVTTPSEFAALQKKSALVTVDDSLVDYAVRLCSATRKHPAVQCGAGPRGSLSLIRSARARALINLRNFVLPDDIKALAVQALAHRLTLCASSELEGTSVAEVVGAIVEQTAAPRD